MATATLALLIISAGVGFIQMLYVDRFSGTISAIAYGGCSWWLYFSSGLFG